MPGLSVEMLSGHDSCLLSNLQAVVCVPQPIQTRDVQELGLALDPPGHPPCLLGLGFTCPQAVSMGD